MSSTPPNVQQAAAISRLFSSSVLGELAQRGASARFSRLANMLSGADAPKSLGQFYDDTLLSLASSDLRDEYVYKSAIVRRILLGRHTLRTATVLSQFRVGTRKADLAILNGTSTVYEIKSERDNLDRLAGQLDAYRRVFARVIVVAAAQHVSSLERVLPAGVGILTLNKRLQLSTVREARDGSADVDPEMICTSLRQSEARQILENLGQHVPDVPNTQQGALLRRIFRNLDPSLVHAEMIRTLGQTRKQAALGEDIERLPWSLHAAYLTMNWTNQERLRFRETLLTPMTTAITWS